MADNITINVTENAPLVPDEVSVNVSTLAGPSFSFILTDDQADPKWEIVLNASNEIEFRKIDGDVLALTLKPNGDLVAVNDIEAGGTFTNLPKATVASLGAIIVGANLTVDTNGVLNASGGSVGATDWGVIGGTLADQTDLNTALGLKADKANPTFTGTLTVPVIKLTTGAADGGIPISSTDGTLTILPAGTSSQILVGNGANPPVWGSNLPTGVTIGSAYIYRAGGTDVPVTDGGTGRSTGGTAYALIATGTTATGAQQTLAQGTTSQILVGGGAALPVWTTATGTGAPVRAGSPTITGTLTCTGDIVAYG